MPSALVAAVPASPHNSRVCHACENPLGDHFLARQICPKCGAPQPVGKSENFFSVLGAPEKFAQDLAQLQKRFYEISRALHPDRFTTSDPSFRQRSLERMSYVNDAYRTLRDPEALRNYVLELHGLRANPQSKGQIPMELAESWFELQDSLAEDPTQASPKVENFKKQLEDFASKSQGSLREIETWLDSLDPLSSEYRTGLEKLSRKIHEQSYLKSLAKDVQRIANRGARDE